MISIIIVVKNDRRICKTLNKLITILKPEKTEILVVDASEGTLDNIKSEFPSIIRWVYFHNYNYKDKGTIPEQRNLGIRIAEGDIIAFIDADCIPENNWLINLVDPLRKEGENIVAGLVKSIRKFPKIWDYEYEMIRDKKYIPEAPTMNLAFKKEILNKIGSFDETFKVSCEDTDFCWKANDYGYKIRYNKKAVIFHDWGDFKRNIKRILNYGEGKFYLLKKYPKRILKFDNFTVIFYCLYILLLPITIFWVYYPLIIIIPLFKNIITKGPLETVFFNLIYALGFIRGVSIKILKSIKICFRNKSKHIPYN